MCPGTYPKIVSEKNNDMKEDAPAIHVALAAYGMSARVFHAPLLQAHPGFHLHSVLQRSKNDAQQKYADLDIVSDYQTLISNKAVELVIVNTPEYLHYEMAAQALEAGKHVVVEKAFTPSVKEAQQLIELAKKQKKILSVFQNSRWHGDFLTIQKIVANKLLGSLVSYEAYYNRFRNGIDVGNWKEEDHPGTGVLYNLGSHMIDQVLLLFGWPEAIQADLDVQRPGGQVEDYFDLKLFYQRLKVTLRSSYLAKEPGPRYVLHGTLGSYTKYGADPQEAHLKAGRSPLEAEWGTEPPENWGRINTEVGGLPIRGNIETMPGSYLDYYDSIYQAIREGKEVAVKAEQALQVIAIIEAAYQSHQGKRRVPLPPPP